MIEFNENVMKSVFDGLSNEEKCILPSAKSIMDKLSGYYIGEKNADMANLFMSISALLSNMDKMNRDGK